jgi:hypothetical protein
VSRPDHEYLRRGEVMSWLTSAPIRFSENAVKKMIDQGLIKGEPIPGGKYDYYRTSQIEREILREAVGQNGVKE